MSTTYPGVATATQAPSVKPTPGVVPSVVIPADGEALNVASITQALKVLADFEAWLMSPRAKASDWVTPVQLWRTAGLKRGFGIDHLGFPMGRLNRWTQNWEGSESVTAAGGIETLSARTDTGWQFGSFKTAGGTGAVSIQIPNSQFPGSRSARMAAGNASGDYSFIVKSAPCLFHANNHVALEWEAKINTLENYAYVMGMGSIVGYLAGTHGALAYFYNFGGGGNWRLHTDDGTTLNDQDSGVAITAANTVRFRISYHGTSVSDDSAERVLFFINEVLVGNLTANMPSVPASPLAAPLFVLFNTGGTGGVVDIGTVQGCNNLWTDAF